MSEISIFDLSNDNVSKISASYESTGKEIGLSSSVSNSSMLLQEISTIEIKKFK